MDEPVVLVVDDDNAVRGSMVSLLQAHGYACTGAGDAQQGLDLLRAGLRPCLILLDLRMPGKTGFDFRAEQTADLELAAIPTVVMSSSNAGTRLADLAGVLPKPLPVEDLLAFVRRHCSSE